MAALPYVLFALAAAYATALAIPLFRRQDGSIHLAAWCLAPIPLACPLLIPSDQVVLRALSALPCTDLSLRVTDYLRHSRHSALGFVSRDYYRFLISFPALLVTFRDHQRRLPHPVPPGPEIARVLLGAAGFAAAFLITLHLADDSALRASHLLDHVVKLGVFIVAIESLSRMLFGLERLAGFDTRPIVHNVLLSRTPAEFWSRRYNHRVSDWLHLNVFRPAGGRRHPVRGTLLVCFASGVLHELMFGIATSRFDGYQFLFFFLQAPAVLASIPLERLARRSAAAAVAARAFTILWMATTSLLFFHGVDRVFPFVYASDPWLP